MDYKGPKIGISRSSGFPAFRFSGSPVLKGGQMMLTKDEARSILDKAMATSVANETEARIGSYRSSLTRFAENHIHQNVSEDSIHFSVNAVLGKRMGSASTSKLDDDSIRKTIADALEIARFTPPDDELLPRLGPQSYRQVDAYDPSIAGLAPMDRAEGVAGVVELCEESGLILNAAGGFISSAGFVSGPGYSIREGKAIPTPEEIHKNWEKINRLDDAEFEIGASSLISMKTSSTEEQVTENKEVSENKEMRTALIIKKILSQLPSKFRPKAAGTQNIIFQLKVSG